MAAKKRLEWVDAAKGVAIILVAVNHSVLFLIATGLADETWRAANKLFQTFRMPLFFLMSGLFARSAINRTWRELWRTRLALLVWAYLLWSLVRFGYFLAFPSPRDAGETDLLRLLLVPVWPTTGLWFLHALALFLVASKLMVHVRIPVWLQLAATAAVAAFFFAFPVITNLGYSGVVRYFVFFLVGCHCRELVLRFADSARLWRSLMLGALFVGASLVVAVSGVHRIALFPLAFLALTFGVALSVQLAKVRGFGWLGVLGRQTLGIYVAHVILIAALTEAALAVGAGGWPGFAWYSPLVVTAAAVAAAVGARSLARGTVLDYAYTAPRWVAGEPPRHDRAVTPTGR